MKGPSKRDFIKSCFCVAVSGIGSAFLGPLTSCGQGPHRSAARPTEDGDARVDPEFEAGYLEPPPAGDTASCEGEEQLRRQYFLDPWRQPYWLKLEPRGKRWGVALLYSFGPNRRRDTLLERLPTRTADWAMAGDDIGLLVEVRRPAPAAAGNR